MITLSFYFALNNRLMKTNKTYFITLGILLVTGFLFSFYYSKAFLFITLNRQHNFLLNVFFINYTFLGDGILALCLVALLWLWFKKKGAALITFFSFLSSGLLVQLIKNSTHLPRPRLYFEPGRYSYFIEGVSMANNKSFPSGHTATAFALATVFILSGSNKKIQLPVLLAALLVGYSRIYLAQHFLEDVLAGAFIGTACAVLSHTIYTKRLYIFKPVKIIRKKPFPVVNDAGLQPG
jgi:membrane-associated phospholipid phosphatase